MTYAQPLRADRCLIAADSAQNAGWARLIVTSTLRHLRLSVIRLPRLPTALSGESTLAVQPARHQATAKKR